MVILERVAHGVGGGAEAPRALGAIDPVVVRLLERHGIEPPRLDEARDVPPELGVRGVGRRASLPLMPATLHKP